MKRRHTKAGRRASFRREHRWLAKLARHRQEGDALWAALAATPDGGTVSDAGRDRYQRTRLRATAPHEYDPEQVDAAGAMRCEACGRDGADALHGAPS